MDQDNVITVKEEKNYVKASGISIIGTRDYQQDTWFISENSYGILAVVCDGMGGMECGELASMKAVERIITDFEAADISGQKPKDFLLREAILLDQLVHDLKDDAGNPLEAGTTLVAVLIADGGAWWISVGDSIIYLIRDEKIHVVNHMHNYRYRLDEQLRNGEITEEKYKEEISQGEALISYLGMGGLELVDINTTPFLLKEGDQIVLGSDGIYKALSPDKVLDTVLGEYRPVNFVLEELMENVRNSGKKSLDNTTAVLLRIE